MDLSTLNQPQKAAVEFGEGALLVLAGAGSGKTRVLTSRIARLIEEECVAPWQVLAFTFTNKAAAEMKERVAQALQRPADGLWIGTFHSICSRLLRREIDALGYNANFTIYDSADQRTLVKSFLRDLKDGSKDLAPSALLSRISQYKNEGLTIEAAQEQAADSFSEVAARVYARYERTKKANNALDFDDLILKTLELANAHPDRFQKYAEQFRYVFVDEYQDTNRVQYDLVRAFSRVHGNLCVVGDVDQSIYGWRGADIHNILDFERDYPQATTILLEQNYRSTQAILRASNTLIENNLERKRKVLWTENPEGDPIRYRELASEVEEAQWVVQAIAQERFRGVPYGDMAILYRTNAQSRAFEEALIREGISYRVVGGLKFYDRAEIKDLIAYMTLVINPSDNLSLLRVINTPKRGIGSSTVEKLRTVAQNAGLSLVEALKEPELLQSVGARAQKNLQDFSAMLTSWQQAAEDSMIELAQRIYQESGYERMLSESRSVEDAAREENIDAFFSAIAQYEEETENASLVDYLQHLSLMSELDKTEDRSGSVQLMTMHAAKGLEFPLVFVTGLEEGLFPSRRSAEEGKLEEERRLFYVAMTRAKKKLYLSGASTRRLYGSAMGQLPSRFVAELEDTVERERPSKPSDSAAYRRGDTYDGNQEKFRVPRFSDPQVRAEYDAQRDRIRRLVQEKKAAQEAAADARFRVGDRVKHRKFGTGMVVSCQERPDGDEITVAFEKKGLKRLNAALAPLQKLS